MGLAAAIFRRLLPAMLIVPFAMRLAGAEPEAKQWAVLPVRAIPHRVNWCAAAGDFNGDKLADVALFGSAGQQRRRAKVAVFLGHPQGLSFHPDWELAGFQMEPTQGGAIASGDFNGDKRADLVVTEWLTEPARNHGFARLHLFPGAPAGFHQPAAQVLKPERFSLFASAASAGDIDGDGFDDLAALGSDPDSKVDFGACILIFRGSPTGLVANPSWVFHSEQESCSFGHRFGSAGDVNGDGFGDFFLSAMTFSGKLTKSGKAYLFFGSEHGLRPEPDWASEYPLAPEPGFGKFIFFGAGMSRAGDVNADGFDDLLIGAWNATQGDVAEGVAFLCLGSAENLSPPIKVAQGSHPHVLLGYGVGPAGDQNGDGFDDVLISAFYASHGQINEGVVMVYDGSKHGVSRRPAWTFDGDRSHGHLGELVMSPGDVNGDGVPDLLFAGADSAESQQPLLRAVVVYGHRGGLTGSSEWLPEKSLLAFLDERLPKVSPVTGWSLISGGVVLSLSALLVTLRQARRRLAFAMAENRRLAATQERTRIARDMHDHLGADLTRLAAQLDRVDREPVPRLKDLRHSAQQAVTTLDELVWATNPAQDSVEGLASYLAEYAPSFCAAHGLACELDVPADLPPLPLPARARHNLFLIAKEALRNLARHAQATRARVVFKIFDQAIHLAIEDDGGGIEPNPCSRATAAVDPVAGRNRLGNGLANMQARARELGTELRVERLPHRGTRVALVLSLAAGVSPHSTPKST